MRHETAVAAGFKKANAATSHMQAYTLAAKLLRETGGKLGAAPMVLSKFLEAIEGDPELLRGCALGFLQFVDRDMKGGAAGQAFIGAHISDAGAPPSEERTIEGLQPGSPVSSPREPSTSQRQAAGRMALKAAESVLQSFKVRDGRAIAKVWRSEISGMIGANWRENAILDRLRNIKMPDGKNDARVGDYVNDAQMKRIVEDVDGSMEAMNAA